MKNLFIFLSIAVLLFGCSEDFLNSTPYAQSTSATFWRNADDAVAAANALYDPLNDEDFYGHGEQTFEICSDDFWRAGDHGEDQAIEEFVFDPSNAQLRSGYTHKYEIVNRANAVLINVPDIDMDPGLKDRVLGEAHFMRGFANWRLHIIYGEVPLIVEQDVIDGNFNKPKATTDEVRAAIEADWLEAAALLPATYSGADIGRPTGGTANGLLTKLYLYMNNLDKAVEHGERVINGSYPLADDYGDNFRIETENNPEMLFSVQAEDGWTTCAYRIYSTPRPWGGWDFHEPIQDLVDEFEEGDPRLDYSIIKPGDVIDLGGAAGPTEYTADLSSTGYHFRKFATWRETGGLNGSQNVPILRTSDVYLMVAEAKIRRDGNGAGDTEINAVRRRVGLSPVSGAGMKELIHERRVELSGENQRHQDLIRWDKAGIIDIVDHYQKDRGAFKPSRNFQRPKHYYFAIPQREIDLSNGTLVQNPNY